MEEGVRLDEKYGYLFQQIVSVARAENKIDEHNIYQEANEKTEKRELAGNKPDSHPGPRVPSIQYRIHRTA